LGENGGRDFQANRDRCVATCKPRRSPLHAAWRQTLPESARGWLAMRGLQTAFQPFIDDALVDTCMSTTIRPGGQDAIRNCAKARSPAASRRGAGDPLTADGWLGFGRGSEGAVELTVRRSGVKRPGGTGHSAFSPVRFRCSI
jgi:hypothetical protein